MLEAPIDVHRSTQGCVERLQHAPIVLVENRPARISAGHQVRARHAMRRVIAFDEVAKARIQIEFNRKES